MPNGDVVIPISHSDLLFPDLTDFNNVPGVNVSTMYFWSLDLRLSCEKSLTLLSVSMILVLGHTSFDQYKYCIIIHN